MMTSILEAWRKRFGRRRKSCSSSLVAPIRRDFTQRNRGADGCASAARFLCFVFTTVATMLVAALLVVYALRDYAPVIANTYEFRRIGEGSTFNYKSKFSAGQGRNDQQ
ncbi:hypothetical protein AB9E17_03770 [Rhizobium leguminosarum]